MYCVKCKKKTDTTNENKDVKDLVTLYSTENEEKIKRCRKMD